MNGAGVLSALEIGPWNSGASGESWIDRPSGGELVSLNPATGEAIARIGMAGADDYERIVSEAVDTFRRWRMMPAPKRGQIVREIGDELRAHKGELGRAGRARNGQDPGRGTRAKCRR